MPTYYQYIVKLALNNDGACFETTVMATDFGHAYSQAVNLSHTHGYPIVAIALA